MAEKIMIPVQDVNLEAVLSAGAADRIGILAHPHPLYGGSMHNNVVAAAENALVKSGWSSLKFNFRGVGRSTGAHGQGLKEQDDLAGVVDFAQNRGAQRILVAGYSFGAWVAAFAWNRIQAPELQPLILIAPPAAFMDFKNLSPNTSVGLIVCGEHDDLGPPRLAQTLCSGLSRPVEPTILPGTDHFFGGREKDLTEVIVQYLDTLE